ncbi:hypothetical protein JCM3775_004813 [Rhodotorula graminis]|uniref:GST C-terminal domain-containing protein n=1 Tax=Rhodotorula graminis (strain WP1) TaxID=578459 RepID=A0A0P9F755_RHOGW|nr:uncharacterized protein RHOBADRAFT_56550 [Rhodotorula graminis WP1]KPV71508.1 hypothetical protein RHOBADRAFT_56550 [Rhodotorula graminis WP1]
MAPKITVHWLRDSRSQRILWLLEELKLDYDIIEYNRDWQTFEIPDEGLEKGYKLKRFPMIILEDADKGFPTPTTLAESGAIFDTLINLYGSPSTLAPAWSSGLSPADAYKYAFWSHWAEGTAMFHLVVYLVLCRTPAKFGFATSWMASFVCGAIVRAYILPNLKKTFSFMEEELGDNEFFVGNKFTACDILLSVPYELLRAIPANPTVSQAEFPRLAAWFERVSTREGHVQAEKRGSKSELAPYFA